MREFEFENVGKRLPYTIPEGFIAEAKSRAKQRAGESHAYSRRAWVIVGRVAAAAAVVLAICGAAIWVERAFSPEQQYERLLAELSSDVLWEYACEYAADVESLEFYQE